MKLRLILHMLKCIVLCFLISTEGLLSSKLQYSSSFIPLYTYFLMVKIFVEAFIT